MRNFAIVLACSACNGHPFRAHVKTAHLEDAAPNIEAVADADLSNSHEQHGLLEALSKLTLLLLTSRSLEVGWQIVGRDNFCLKSHPFLNDNHALPRAVVDRMRRRSLADGIHYRTVRTTVSNIHMGFVEWWQDLWKVPEYTPAAKEVLEAMQRPDGWEVDCEIGSDIAKSVGGSGQLAKGSPTSTVTLNLRLAFSLKQVEGNLVYYQPKGSVKLLRPSKYVSGDGSGFWTLEPNSMYQEGVPQQVQWCVDLPDGLSLGEQTLVPPGPLYFNALVEATPSGVVLSEGRLTVKEELPGGILAEFKIVGVFDVKQIPAQM